jgi:L-2,4-diaminobutyrate decarboxylase
MISITPNGIDHYSSRLAIGWLGIGESNVIRAPTKDFKYDIKKLSNLMYTLSQQGKKIISLVAYAGDSRSMTCDDFFKLRELCDTYNTWFHVDGCHGTQLLFSEKLKIKIKGIELADSVTLDPHKVLNVPYAISILMLKDPSHIKKIQRIEDIITGEEHSFGQITPFFGSRSFLSLKLYFLFKNLGKSGLAKVIERRNKIAYMLANKISHREEFILINPQVDINSVIFMYSPRQLKKIKKVNSTRYLEISNKLNTYIHNQLLNDDKIWLHNFQISDLANSLQLGREKIIRPLRFMSGNPLVTEQHLDHMLDSVDKCGKKILEEIWQI